MAVVYSNNLMVVAARSYLPIVSEDDSDSPSTKGLFIPTVVVLLFNTVLML